VKKLFAAAIFATKVDLYPTFTKTTNAIGARGFLAINEEEAIGKAQKAAEKAFPPSEGYGNHMVSVVEIPDDFIEEHFLK